MYIYGGIFQTKEPILLESNIRNMSAGRSHVALLTDKGDVIVYGSDKQDIASWKSPRLFDFNYFGGKAIKRVSCGSTFTAAITGNNLLYY